MGNELTTFTPHLTPLEERKDSLRQKVQEVQGKYSNPDKREKLHWKASRGDSYDAHDIELVALWVDAVHDHYLAQKARIDAGEQIDIEAIQWPDRPPVDSKFFD